MHTHTHTPNRKRIHEIEELGGNHLGDFGGRKGKGGWYNCGLKRKL